ncbi:hypothetical protein MMC31_007157 [Peltigera leucophlebia]|nr:hypothetical protein [Peltigera leucophlebia]
MSRKWMKKLGFSKTSQIPGTLSEHTSAATSASKLPEDNAEGTSQSHSQAINLEAASAPSSQKGSTVSASKQGAYEENSAGLLCITSEQIYRRSFYEMFPNGGTIGLRVLHMPTNTSDNLVDIIFVHGLTGNSYSTWLDEKSKTYWPVHLLHHSLPNARIMAFGYNADVAKFIGPVGQNNLRDHALTLLGDLGRIRREPESNNRKIVFVAHSLGGLVTKKALCLSENSFESHLKQADACTIAVAFLGTPHRGLGLAPFAKGVTNILKASHKRVNTDIISLLQRKSEVLGEVEDYFGIWLRKKGQGFNMTCFYEEWELPGLGLVVAKDSAQINGFPQLPIPANHIGMTKFVNSEEVGYQRIVGEIERWTQTARPKDLTQEEQDCLQSLSFEQMNNRGIDIEQAADGTCIWLFTHKTYRQWLSQDQGLLWISGKPGAGKSTLMKYALQAIQQGESMSLSKPMTLSFFFHGRGAEIQRTPFGMFRSLLHQLLKKFPGPLSEVVRTFQSNCKDMEKWEWHQKDLQRLLKTCIPNVLEECAVRILVDALDECGEIAARELVTYFQDHSQAIGGGLEFCVERENHNDIKSYIQEKLQHAIHNDKELEILQDEIFKRSSCIFQWVVLVLDRAIWQYREGYSVPYILEQLYETPADLDSLYKSILQGLNKNKQNQSRSLKLMQWICFARRPLSLTELRFAMILDSAASYPSLKQCQLSPDFIKDDEKMENQLKSLSGGLAEVKVYDNEPVAQFIHQSVNDHIIKGGFQILDGFSKTEDMSIGLAHVQMSRSCIRYFSMDEIRESVSKEGQIIGGLQTFEFEFPFIEYTTKFWLDHAKMAEEYGMSQAILLDYFCWPSTEIIQSWAGIFNSIDKFSYERPNIHTTLLHTASKHGLISIVRAIIDQTERNNLNMWSTKDSYNWMPLSVITGDGHETGVKLLLEKGADIDSKDSYGQTPLLWAAKNGHATVVMLLLEKGANVKSGDFHNQTSLLWAAECGHETVVKLLLEKGADIESKDSRNRTPLLCAAKNGHITVVKLLLEKRVNIECKDSYSQTPLLWAARNGHKIVVRLLLEKDVNVESEDSYNRTPLSWAAEGGHETVVKLLLEKGVNVEPKDSIYGRTPLSWAAEKGHKTVVKLLLETGVVVESKDSLFGQTPLSLAAWNGHETVVELLLEKNAEVESKYFDNRTPLSRAAENGHKTVIKLLLENGAKFESKDSDGRTPLSWAAENGHETVVTLLLEKGANVESKDSDDRTPLSWAAEKGDETVVKLLLEKGANVESKISDDRTPLSWAAWNGHETVVNLLLEKGANVECKDSDNRTPLSWAAQYGGETVVKLLLEKGANVESKDSDDRTPLSWAAENGDEAVVKLLLEKSADVESKDSFNRTPLLRAAKNGHEAVVKLLREKGANVESKDSDDRTPLSWAAEKGDEAVVKLLLEKSADVESKDSFNRTPLLRTEKNGHEAVVKLLREKSADIECKDLNGHTPL